MSFSRLISAFLLLALFSCAETSEKAGTPQSSSSLQDSVTEYNHEIVRSELQEIDDYILRYHWKMQKTQTGLQYMIYQRGDGQIPGEGDQVTVKYKVNLLNGDFVYATDGSSGFTFETGKRDVVSGLEEGVMLMRTGDHAKLIVPSHLAFGLLGDLAKIPTRAVLVYDVELCKINRIKK
jgi:FKBP-type peptidyl-prolyl cis-trans isomerase